MGGAEGAAPPGGLPWLYVGVMGTFLGGGIAALWARLWLQAKAHEAALAAKDALLAAGVQARENLRLELQGRIDREHEANEEKDRQIQAQLREALDNVYALRRGKPPRPPAPPSGVQRRTRTTEELLAEVRTATGIFRLEDLEPPA